VLRKGWTAYAAFLTLASIMGEVWNVAHDRVDARTYANWILTFVLLLATWGYALRYPIGSRRYWGPAFWVILAATAITIIPVAIAGIDGMVVVMLSLLVIAPAFYAAFRYAYRSPELWPMEESPP
jgi:hypothetical protein